MFTAGQVQLQSMTLLQGHHADRPSFEATVCRLFSARPYQVFALPPGLLFLEQKVSGGPGGGNTNAIVVGAVLGGALGACIGAALTSNAAAPSRETGLDLYSEEELFELARARKRSFVCRYDDIRSVAIEAPGAWDRMFAASNLAGYVTLRDNTRGKIKLEINDQAALSVAVDALPRRLGERVWSNVEFDKRSTRFVPKRG